MTEPEELTNGLDHEADETYRNAAITLNLPVIEILGRVLKDDTEKDFFLMLTHAFFSSDFLFEQFKIFVLSNMQPESRKPELYVPEPTKLILP
jgi:hypothetical protein